MFITLWFGFDYGTNSLKDRNGEPERGGEWMGADKNSIQEFGLW
jgi:hypothetical protein